MISKEEYINSIEPGNIIAFKVNDSLMSGKVVSVDYEKHNPFVVSTNNASIYFVSKENVVWVKNGSKWPVGIFNALKYKNKGFDKNE